ncbi:MAG: putative murein hydrolase EnvC, partial [bacterium]
SASRRYLSRLDTQQKLLDIEIERKEEGLTRAGAELERRRQRLAGWMRQAYKKGRTRNLEVFFSSADFGDLLKKSYFLSAVMQQERHVIEDVREQRLLVENEKTELEQRERQVLALRGDKEAEQDKYKSLKQSQSAEVSKVRTQRQSYEQAAKELEAAATKMQKLLANLEEQRKKRLKGGQDNLAIELDRNNFGANRGRLPWPVQGEIIGNFGLETHPEWGTQVRNNGLDIRADDGTPVRCVGEGRIELVDWLPGYGLLLGLFAPGERLGRGRGAHRGRTGPGHRRRLGKPEGRVPSLRNPEGTRRPEPLGLAALGVQRISIRRPLSVPSLVSNRRK